MSSPYRVIQKAIEILETRDFCLFDDPRFNRCGIARRADGTVTSPENLPATMFTLTGAVARAIYDLTGETWIQRATLYDSVMNKLQSRVSYNHRFFLNHCDKLNRDGCIKLLKEVLDS